MEKNQKNCDIILNAITQRGTAGLNAEAYRLFNGFYEGIPGLVLDRYGPTLVVFDHNEPGDLQDTITEIGRWAIANIDGLDSVLLKQRQHPQEQIKNGILIAGEILPEVITEFGVKYAINLQMNQDASFYLDTRNLRRWLLDHMTGLRVLNTFAYTGSLGVAAGMGRAKKVIQSDINGRFLEVAQQSWKLNDLPKDKTQVITGDFFRVAGRMRTNTRLFNCVIIDPPFFSSTTAGKVDLNNQTTRLVNKIRPVVAHEGFLVVINNALFLPGESFMAELEALCQSPYISFEQIIPIPPDITGYPDTIVDHPPANPAPFNHPTKIAILKVFRKDEQK